MTIAAVMSTAPDDDSVSLIVKMSQSEADRLAEYHDADAKCTCTLCNFLAALHKTTEAIKK